MPETHLEMPVMPMEQDVSADGEFSWCSDHHFKHIWWTLHNPVLGQSIWIWNLILLESEAATQLKLSGIISSRVFRQCLP